MVMVVISEAVASSQASVVRTLPSSQLSGVPGLQVPPPHTSWPLQTVLSSQEAVLLVWKQPLTALQASSVQTLLSSQLSGVPGLQVPPPHTSWPLQAVLSSQEAVLFVWKQPVCALQASSVQTLPSLQSSGAPPTQAPALQVSPVVQALPSSQEAVLFVKTHPVAGAQLSSVQTFWSLQTSAGPPWQVPPPQVSFVEQALPSLQEAGLFVNAHPAGGTRRASSWAVFCLQQTAATPRFVWPPAAPP